MKSLDESVTTSLQPLIGKSENEVTQIIGSPPHNRKKWWFLWKRHPMLEYKIHQSHVSVYFMDNKALTISWQTLLSESDLSQPPMDE